MAANPNPFGEIYTPKALQRFKTLEEGGLGQLISLFTSILIIGAGIFALFNFILAGYAFLSAGDDPKQIQSAWAKIYQSILGLTFAAGAFIIAALVGLLLFGDGNALVNPSIPAMTP